MFGVHDAAYTGAARAMTHEEFRTERGSYRFDNYFETAHIPATTITTKNEIVGCALINSVKNVNHGISKK